MTFDLWKTKDETLIEPKIDLENQRCNHYVTITLRKTS